MYRAEHPGSGTNAVCVDFSGGQQYNSKLASPETYPRNTSLRNDADVCASKKVLYITMRLPVSTRVENSPQQIEATPHRIRETARG